MKFVVGLVVLTFALIEARSSSKIQIFEIRDDGNNGVTLTDLNNPHKQENVLSKLLKLFGNKKQDNRNDDISEQLVKKLTDLKGDEGNKIGEDAYVYTLKDVVFNDDKSSINNRYDSKTTNDRSELQLTDLLQKLLGHNHVSFKKKPKSSSSYIQRVGDIIEDRTLPPPAEYRDIWA